jgi:hypothetical protein
VTTTHKTLVAALSGASDTGAVLRAALGFAPLVGTGLEALQVAGAEEHPGDADQQAHVAGVRCHQRHGPVADRILAGETAPRRLVVPLDGSAAASSAYLGMEGHFRPDADRETIVLYVLDGLTPRMLDRPERDFALWGDEFVRRHCPGEHRSFEWATGDPGAAVVELAERAAGDLIVLCFGGNFDRGHGAVVHEVLARSPIPVLVLPPPARIAAGPSSTIPRRSATRR